MKFIVLTIQGETLCTEMKSAASSLRVDVDSLATSILSLHVGQLLKDSRREMLQRLGENETPQGWEDDAEKEAVDKPGGTV